MAMAMVVNLFFNPAFSLMPLLVKDHFQGGVIQLAWMETGFGAGMIAGSLLLGVWGGFTRKLYTLLLGVAVMGLAAFFLGVLPSSGILTAIAAMVIIGIAQPLTNAPLIAIIQGTVPLELQGRVIGLPGECGRDYLADWIAVGRARVGSAGRASVVSGGRRCRADCGAGGVIVARFADVG
jgi:DHA3 family macrolide efflux protein-like MFS transporter